MRREARAWSPAVLWTAFLFFLSELRGVPSGLEPLLVLPDKLIHFGLYLVLGLFMGWARGESGLRASHLFFIGVGSAYGALDEWHQSFVPGRTPELGDWVADTAGVAVGYVAFTLSGRRWARGLEEAGGE